MRAALALFCLVLAGCGATCEQVCDHIVACEELPTERMSSAECEASCREQKDLYDRWADIQKQDALQAELDCLRDAPCEDIAVGVCYDPAIWSY